MKKVLVVLTILCISVSIYAKSIFEFGVKGFSGYNSAQFTSIVDDAKYDDLIFGYGAQINWCFNRFLGVTIGLNSIMPMYTRSQIGNAVETGGFQGINFDNNWGGFTPSLGFILMIPINDHFRVKTTYNFAKTYYDRFAPINGDNNKQVRFYYEFYGFLGEIAAYWIPMKLMGLEFGAQYNIYFDSERQNLPVSGYPYTRSEINWCVKPYVGVSLRLGRGK